MLQLCMNVAVFNFLVFSSNIRAYLAGLRLRLLRWSDFFYGARGEKTFGKMVLLDVKIQRKRKMTTSPFIPFLFTSSLLLCLAASHPLPPACPPTVPPPGGHPPPPATNTRPPRAPRGAPPSRRVRGIARRPQTGRWRERKDGCHKLGGDDDGIAVARLRHSPWLSPHPTTASSSHPPPLPRRIPCLARGRTEVSYLDVISKQPALFMLACLRLCPAPSLHPAAGRCSTAGAIIGRAPPEGRGWKRGDWVRRSRVSGEATKTWLRLPTLAPVTEKSGAPEPEPSVEHPDSPPLVGLHLEPVLEPSQRGSHCVNHQAFFSLENKFKYRSSYWFFPWLLLSKLRTSVQSTLQKSECSLLASLGSMLRLLRCCFLLADV
jgi:hypothetical protein